MVGLLPVRAWHPDPSRVDPNELVCPVYDTLTDDELERFSGHPSNAARFVPRPHQVPVDDFVRTARTHLDEALASGAYVRDSRPALYVYGIRYVPPPDILETIPPEGRRKEYLLLGLVGSLDLARAGPGSVALHERTFDDRVDERMRLTDATRTSFAPILAGYHQPEHRLNDALEDLLGLDRRGLSFNGTVAPVAEATLDGTTHRLWRIDSPHDIDALRREVEGLRVLVLDGHHRFTAAKRREAVGRPTAPLMMLVDGQDRALRVLPWHRVLPARVRQFSDVLREARNAFPACTRASPTPVSPADAIERLERMRAAGHRGFLASNGRELYEVGGTSSPDVGADFDLLHGFLEGRLGIDPHELLFVRSPRSALDRLTTPNDPGVGGTALLLPPLTEQGIEARAFGGGAVMAHKSTMFLPKVVEGLLFAPADRTGERV